MSKVRMCDRCGGIEKKDDALKMTIADWWWSDSPRHLCSKCSREFETWWYSAKKDDAPRKTAADA